VTWLRHDTYLRSAMLAQPYHRPLVADGSVLGKGRLQLIYGGGFVTQMLYVHHPHHCMFRPARLWGALPLAWCSFPLVLTDAHSAADDGVRPMDTRHYRFPFGLLLTVLTLLM
jgi:hypothetical protein